MYDAAGGPEGLRALAEAWHQRVLADEVVDPLSPHPYPALWLLAVSAAVVVASFLLSLVWGKLGLRRFLG